MIILKIIKNNIEVIVVLLITFAIYVMVVLFYEDKINSFYYNNDNYLIKEEIVINKIINNDILLVKQNNDTGYIELDPNTVSLLKENKKYTITLKTTDSKVAKGNLTQLFLEYDIMEIYEKIYNK